MEKPWPRRRAPYDRVIATCAVRRIPHAWVRQTKPGGIILATIAPGSWAYGTGLAKVTVNDDGTAGGRIIRESSFMQARSQAVAPLAGDLSARTAYADSERGAKVPPTLMEEWMPAFLVQLAAPGAQLVRVALGDGTPQLYVFDADRESFAAFTENGSGWTVRQGGPVALWDDIEQALIAWRNAGRPGISTMRLRITPQVHLYEARELSVGPQRLTPTEQEFKLSWWPMADALEAAVEGRFLLPAGPLALLLADRTG